MTDTDRAHLRRAARLALRGHGGAEPNPLVGCVIVAPDGTTVGWGHHHRCGGPHAEVHALRRAGDAARGATAYVTLEPCNHTGRTGPCAEALVAAGVARVVVARRDPNAVAAGGLERLEAAGIAVAVEPEPAACDVLTPFAHRIGTGRPWIVAKWAQTLDGRVATRTGASRWISGSSSRAMVHRERGRVDAIVVGAGTAIADDPMLTARDVRVRRVARRVVLDSKGRLPPASRLLATANIVPTTVVTTEAAPAETRSGFARAGAEVHVAPAADGRVDLTAAFAWLAETHDVTNALVEPGPTLLGSMLAQDLVDEAWVFVAPMVMADAEARPCAVGMTPATPADAVGLRVTDVRRRGDDVVMRLRKR